MSDLLPLDLDADGSYQHAQVALRAAIEATAHLTRLHPGRIASEALVAALIDQILEPENRWAFKAMLDRAIADSLIERLQEENG